jgi:threonine/homoserine/homoserine lactone efflux protein
LGILSGVLVHITLAAFGLSVALASSAMAFSVVKYVGAAYLIYLGISRMFAGQNVIDDSSMAKKKTDPTSKIYTAGVFANLLNPKVPLFLLAFFPQFIKPTQIASPLPFLILGLIYLILDLIWCSILVVGASYFSRKIKDSLSIGLWMNKISGGVFISLGIKVALSDSP